MEALKGKKAADVDLKKLCATCAESFLALEITQGCQAVFDCITVSSESCLTAGYLKEC